MVKKITFDDLLNGETTPILDAGETVEGKVLSVKKNEVLIDLGQYGVGFVPRREVSLGKKLTVGENVTVSVVDTDMDDGMILLSLRKADKEKGWDEIVKVTEEGRNIEVVPYDANKGGLLIEYEGVRGFMPVSQLSAEHYPRVSGREKEEIIQRLDGLVGKPILVQIIDADKRNNKLIFSEKEAIKDGLSERFASLKVGDAVKGKVTGVLDFGAFVNVDGIEGLIHISEISWERVNSPSDYLKVGDEIETKIIAIDKDRLSLSLKQLKEDPWLEEIEKYKVGDEVTGTVTRITPFGAFVQINPAIEALVHVSELGKGEDVDPEKVFNLNEKKTFNILEIDKDNRKISLSLKK